VVQREPLAPDQNWSVLSVVPTVLSFEPETLNRQDVSLVKVEVPSSKEKLRSALSTRSTLCGRGASRWRW